VQTEASLLTLSPTRPRQQSLGNEARSKPASHVAPAGWLFDRKVLLLIATRLWSIDISDWPRVINWWRKGSCISRLTGSYLTCRVLDVDSDSI
jgi:hypothetical protein